MLLNMHCLYTTCAAPVWGSSQPPLPLGADAAAVRVWCDTGVAAQVMVFLPTARLTQLYAEVFQRMQVCHRGCTTGLMSRDSCHIS